MNDKPATDKKSDGRRRIGVAGILRRFLFVLACLVTLIAILYAEEDWRGKRAWENFRHEWEAKGEKFDLQSFVPPSVPDDQNFAMTPFLAPLFDYNPQPLGPGQSLYRDTNAFDRALNFANDLPSPESSNSWARSEPVDLPAWAAGFKAKAKVPASNAAPLTRGEAAAVVLQGLEKYRPVLDEIQSASRRPYCRFKVNYGADFPAAIMVPHLLVVKRMAQLFLLRASAELALDQRDAAFTDIKMALYLAGTMKGEPFLLSGLVRIAILQLALPHVWEGLAAHQWTGAQLAEFQTELGGIDMLAEYGAHMRGERACANGCMDYLRSSRRINELGSDGGDSQTSYAVYSIMPAGWFYRNELAIDQMNQELFFTPADAVNHRVYVDKVSAIQGALGRELNSGFPPYKIFARVLLPALENAIRRYASAQANLDLASVACALERYHLANEKYPEVLDALTPKFIAKIPHDIISGEPLKYHRTDAGQFLLYSVGWNGVDDGGTVAVQNGGKAVDITQGDWVWPPYPPK
jgi:hypothetical protein